MSSGDLVVGLDGLAYGLLLFIVASGFALSYGVAGVLNLAHGVFFLAGAYLAWRFVDQSWSGLALALLAATLCGAVCGLLVWVIARLAPDPLEQGLATVGLALIGGQVLTAFFGAEPLSVSPPAGLAGSVDIGGQHYPVYRLTFIAAAGLLAAGLAWWTYRSRGGLLVRAAAADPGMLSALGVEPRRVQGGALVGASVLAVTAGVLGAPLLGPAPGVDHGVLLLSLVIVVAGRGSIVGGLVAAAVVGQLKTTAVVWWPNAAPVLIYVALLAALILQRGWVRREAGAAEDNRPVRRTAISWLPAHRAVAVVGLGVAFALPWLVSAYLVSVASYALAVALLALSVYLLTAVAGQPSLGQAAFFGVGAYTAAWTGRYWDLIGPAQLIAGVLVGAIAAGVTGLLVCRTRGIAFMLATFALGEVAFVVADQWRPVTGGGTGMTSAALQLYPGATLRLDGHLYLYVLAIFVVLAAATALLVRSRFGLVLRALAARETRLQANGYSTTVVLWAAYVIAGAIAAAAGVLMVAGRGYVAPSDLSFAVSALALLAAIIGRGHLLWACVAALGIVALRDIGGNIVTGQSPLLLGIAFLAAAVAVGHRRGQPREARP